MPSMPNGEPRDMPREILLAFTSHARISHLSKQRPLHLLEEEEVSQAVEWGATSENHSRFK